MLRRKGEPRNLREHKKKIAKRNLLEQYKSTVFPKKV